MPEWCPSVSVTGRKHRIGFAILCTECARYRETRGMHLETLAVAEEYGAERAQYENDRAQYEADRARYETGQDGSMGPFCMIGPNIQHKTGTKPDTCQFCRVHNAGKAERRRAERDGGTEYVSAPGVDNSKRRDIHITWGVDKRTQGVFNPDGSRVRGVTSVEVDMSVHEFPQATVHVIMPNVDVLVPEDRVTWKNDEAERTRKAIAAELRQMAARFREHNTDGRSTFGLHAVDRLISRATELENEK